MPLSVADYLRLPVAAPDHRLEYGEGPSCFGELTLPSGRPPHPVAIVLHGGCWLERYDLAPLSGLCAALAREGVAAWNLEYRRLGGGGGWPATFHDVAAGADFLRSLAPRFGLDLTRAVALGHSAGGHLALWLAARRGLPAGSELGAADPLRLRGVVALAALADLAEGARRGLCGGACERLLGGDPRHHPERYAQGSPIALLPYGIPQWHIVGAEDAVVPPDYVRAAAARARHHDEVHLEVVPGVGHFEPAVPAGPAWESIRAAVARLAGPAAGSTRA